MPAHAAGRSGSSKIPSASGAASAGVNSSSPVARHFVTYFSGAFSNVALQPAEQK